ncbi:MAG: NAD(P)-dependent oxidoreductase [Janthinobacterium lividum]
MDLTVGYIGLGDIGAPMAERIRGGGFELLVWNRSPKKMAPLVAAGAVAAASAADLARRCDIVCLCLTNAEAVEAVVFGPEGVAAGAGRVKVLVDNSTIHPVRTQQFAEQLRTATGIHWLDVPVSGGPVGARAGTLAAMAGGDAADLELASPVIKTYSNHITHMGPTGCGQATKACNQVVNFATMGAIAEAVSLGAHFGLDIKRLPEAWAGGLADSNMLREYARATSLGEERGITALINGLIKLYDGDVDARLRGRLGILLKDFGIGLDLGRATGSAMPISSVLDSLYRVLHHQRASDER